MHKSIILNSLKESFTLIWKNKYLSMLLFVLELLFLVVFSYVNIVYQSRMLENAKTISEMLNKEKLDEADISSKIMRQEKILGEELQDINKNFDELAKNFKLFAAYSFILIAAFASLNWSAASRMFNKKGFKQFLKIFLRVMVISVFYFGLIFWASYSLLSTSAADIENIKSLSMYIEIVALSAILLYFMFISLALSINNTFKDIIQKTLLVGIKKIHYILAAYFINILIFAVAIALLLYFAEKSMFILTISIILATFSFVFGRIFLINVVDKVQSSG